MGGLFLLVSYSLLIAVIDKMKSWTWLSHEHHFVALRVGKKQVWDFSKSHITTNKFRLFRSPSKFGWAELKLV